MEKKQYHFHPNDTKLDKKIVEITENPGFKIALFSIAAMTVLGSVVITSALPTITRHFDEILRDQTTPLARFTFEHLDILTRLILTIPAIFVVILSPFAGMLMDKFGKLRFVFPAMTIWTLSGVSGFFLNDIYAILASRAIFGMATAFIMTGASALLGDYYSHGGFNRRENALSWQGFFCAIGGAVFISIAGYVSSYSWRYPFLVYGLGILITLLAFIYLFEPRKFKFYNHDGIENEKINYWQFVPVYFIGFFIMVVYYISPTQLPYYIEDHLKLDPKYIGISMSVSAFCYGLFSLSYKNIIKYFSVKQIYIFTLFIVGTSFLLLYFVHNFIAVLISLALLGTGGGIMLVNNSAHLFAICPENARARAYGILSSCIFLGQFLSPIISQPIVRQIGLIPMLLVWAIVVYVVIVPFLFLKTK